MITSKLFAHKRFLILGLGLTGAAATKALIASKAKVWVFDSDVTKLPVDGSKIASDLSIIKNTDIDFVVVSPGIPEHNNDLRLLKHNIDKKKFISDIDLLYLACPHSFYICVTGTNGKSTVVSKINHLLVNHLGKKSCKGGNIGVPTLELPLNMDYYVIEMSSYQIEKSSIIKPNIGIVLNISPDHIDHHLTLKNYEKEKIKLLELSKTGIFACLDEYTSKIAATSGHTKHIHRLYWPEDTTLRATLDKLAFPKNSFVSAYAVSLITQLDITQLSSYLKDFKPLPYRISKFYTWLNVEFINDSKATNLSAALYCLNTLTKDNYDLVLMLVGGVLKSGDKELLQAYPITKPEIKNLKFISFGKEASFLKEVISKKDLIGSYKTMKEAITALPSLLNNLRSSYKSIAVVLSPIGVSFDEFDSYKHRGEVFDELVKKLFV